MNKLFQLKLFQINFSQKHDSSYGLNTLGPLCLWQCLHLDTILCRYKWLVFNPECNTINKEISLTLSRLYKARTTPFLFERTQGLKGTFRCKRGVRSATQEFTCDNGYCIPLEKRCDQTEDCRFIS